MRTFSYCAAAALFFASGFLHIVRPGAFLAIMPPYIPYHHAVVLISGLAEIAGAIGLLIPASRSAAAWCLALLLVAVFPANIYMAANNIPFGGRPLPVYILWGRLFLQPLLVWWMVSIGRLQNPVR